MSLHMTFFAGACPFSPVLTFGMILVKSIVLQRRCIFSGGHILSFSFLSTLFSTLHPLQLGELQLCTSQDQRLPLLAKSICVAIESLPNLLFRSPGPYNPKYMNASIHPRFHECTTHTYTHTRTHKQIFLFIHLPPHELLKNVSPQLDKIRNNENPSSGIMTCSLLPHKQMN